MRVALTRKIGCYRRRYDKVYTDVNFELAYNNNRANLVEQFKELVSVDSGAEESFK